MSACCALAAVAAAPSAQDLGDFCGLPPRTDLLPVLIDSASLPQVTPPALWYSGDTHEHVQLCPLDPGPPPVFPPDQTPAEIYAEIQADNLNVSNCMVWIPRSTNPDDFLLDYAPRVNGMEDPATAGDPDHFFQYGLETSGAPRPSALGHIGALNIEDGFYDLTVDYPALALDFFNAQPNTVAGYCHQGWPTGLNYPGVAIQLAPAFPYLAPFDVAQGKVDYLESIDLEFDPVLSLVPEPWYGMYYKLLSAGLKVGIGGGTDTNCVTTLSGLEMRTWTRIESDPLDYDKWTAALGAGRTTLSLGPSEFLDLNVEGQPIAGQVFVDAPGMLQVAATLHVAVGHPVADTIEIIQDRQVVASQFVELPAGGTHDFELLLPVQRSGWIAARTTRTHTAAIYVYVGNKPVANEAEAQYWVVYHDSLLFFALSLAVSNPDALEAFVGDSLNEILDYIADGRAVFAALRDLDSPLPVGMTRIGVPTPACQGPLAIVPRGAAFAGQPVRLACLGAPPQATGLLVGGTVPHPGFFFGGAQFFVSPVPLPALFPVTASESGFASIDADIPQTAAGIPIYVQYAWFNTSDCSGAGSFSASDALEMLVQP